MDILTLLVSSQQFAVIPLVPLFWLLGAGIFGGTAIKVTSDLTKETKDSAFDDLTDVSTEANNTVRFIAVLGSIVAGLFLLSKNGRKAIVKFFK